MKTLVTATLFTLTTLSMSPATAQSAEACHTASEIVSSMVEARDNGVPAKASGIILIENGVPRAIVSNVITFVYGIHAGHSAGVVVEDFLGNCLGEGA